MSRGSIVVNVRGTHGSGKSTLVKTLIHRYRSATLRSDGGVGKPLGYRLTLPWPDLPLYVVGPYETACGGCDAVQPYSLVWPRVVEYANMGHVLFEGALISTTYGSIGEASETMGDRFVFAFMDTPLAECLDRVKRRRAARGNDKPLDPKNTTSKYETIDRLRGKLLGPFKRRVVVLDHRKAVANLLGVYRAG